MNIHIYIESDKVEYLKNILNNIDEDPSLEYCDEVSLFYQNIPAKGWIQVSMSSNEFISLTDRDILNELIEL